MTIQQHELGSILSTHGSTHICERGLCHKSTSILWDQVDCLLLDVSKLTLTGSSIGDNMQLRVISTTQAEIDLTHRGLFGIGRKAQAALWDSYQLIVSKVIDRQWAKLTADIAEGKTVTFFGFHIDSSAIYRPKFFRGYHTVDLRRIVGCDFYQGDFYIHFLDDKERSKSLCLGHVRDVPNIHLARVFLLSKARQNSVP